MTKISFTKRIAFAAVPLLIAYLVMELAVTLWVRHSWWGSSLWLFEESGRTIQFDPVRGYRLMTIPSRFMRITNGTVEYVGTLRGNGQGFPDRHDFSIKRPAGVRQRYAVFGDSYTAGQFLGRNWPARAGELLEARGEPVELLNFAVDGGGLANWWSVITRHIAVEKYELDGLIFAVYENNLQRPLAIAEHRGQSRHMFRWVPTWDAEKYPKTSQEALKILPPVEDAYVLSAAEFERVLQGEWPAAVSRPWRPVIAQTVVRRLVRPFKKGLEARPDDPLVRYYPDNPSTRNDPHRLAMIEDIRQFVTARRLQVTVVLIPDRATLLKTMPPRPWVMEEAKEFATALGAKMVDSSRMFDGMSADQIKRQFLPYDGHLNQAGSDRLAEFVLANLPAGQASASR